MAKEKQPEENFSFDEIDDEQSINAILNDQQSSNISVLKNILIILVIIAIGMGVFWGSFVLGKKVFNSATPVNEPKTDKAQDGVMYDLPDEEVIYEIETSDKKTANSTAKEAAKEPAPAKVTSTQPKPVKMAAATKEPVSTQKPAPAPKTAPAIKSAPAAAKSPVMYKVIVGSYTNLDNARAIVKNLKAKGIEVYIAKITVKGVPMWRVQIGAFDKVDQATTLIKKVKADGIDAFYIQE